MSFLKNVFLIAVFNKDNQQGPAGQPRELCSTLCNNLMVTRGKDGGRDSQGAWDGHGHTAVFNMENKQGPAAQPRELSSMSRGSLDGRGVWGRRDTCTYINPFAIHLKLSQHCLLPIPPTQIKTLLFKKKSIQKKVFIHFFSLVKQKRILYHYKDERFNAQSQCRK